MKWYRSGVFIVNSEDISHLLPDSFVDFEQMNICWDNNSKWNIHVLVQVYSQTCLYSRPAVPE